MAQSDNPSGNDTNPSLEQFTFLEALLSGKNPNIGKILIWRKNGDVKVSSWFNSASQAAGSVIDGEPNVYVSAGISPQDYGSKNRAKQHQVIGVSAFSVDIDFMHAAHKQAGLPETPEKAYGLIQSFKLTPSVVINSGHGYQAWYILTEPFMFKKKSLLADRAAAIELAMRLVYTFKGLSDYHVDSTFDLSRVMRVPGTVNQKPGCDTVPVTIHSLGGIRYSLLDIDGACIPVTDLPSRAKKTTSLSTVDSQGRVVCKEGAQVGGDCDSLTLSLENKPSFMLFEALYDSDVTFQRTWRHKRDKTPEKPDGFPSGSEYDMALASYAVGAGWPDQEVANLLTAWRIKHKNVEDPDKALRMKYMVDTICRAKKKINDKQANKVLETTKAVGEFTVFSEKDRELARKTFKNATRLGLIDIIQYTGDTPTYVWNFEEHGEIKYTPDQHLYPKQWFKQTYNQTLAPITRVSEKNWAALLDVIRCLITRHTETSPEDRMTTYVTSLLEEYIVSFTHGDKGYSICMGEPFLETPSNEIGHWWVHLGNFAKWCKKNHDVREEKTYFSMAFKSLGLKRKRKSGRWDKNVYTKQFYEVPTAIYGFSGANLAGDVVDVDETEQELAKVIPMETGGKKSP